MTGADLSAFTRDLGREIKELVSGYLQKSLAGFAARLTQLETKMVDASLLVGPQGEPGPAGPVGSVGEKGEPGIRGEAGPAGINGKDADLSLLLALKSDIATIQGEWTAFKAWQSGAIGEALAKMQPPEPDPVVLDGLVQKHVQTQHKALDEDALVTRVKSAVLEAIPTPRDGKDGTDGRDVDPAVVDVMVSAQVERAVKDVLPRLRDDATPTSDVLMPLITKAMDALPKPKDGKDGEPGAAGPPGPPGAVGAQGPAGEPGATGPQGESGRDGADGTPGEKGLDGKDGVGFADVLINRDGHLVLTFTNGETKDVGLVLGKDVDAVQVSQIIREEVAKIPRPKDGADGKDGIGFDDLDLTFDERNGFVLKAVSGDRAKEWPLPIQWDAGTWKHGVIYPKGANVTDHGAYYTALSATSARPGQPSPESRAWRLIVKKGQDGKPGKDGKDSE